MTREVNHADRRVETLRPYDAKHGGLLAEWPYLLSRVCEAVEPQKRRFVLHQDREDIAAGRICNATRVRSCVTLSGVCVTVPG